MAGVKRGSWFPVLRALLIASVLAGGTTLAEQRIERPKVDGQELLYFPNGDFLREAALGYEQAAAAITWIQAIQYYGGHVRSDYDFRHMHHLCSVVTELDPYFLEPYIFGSYVMVTDLYEPDKAMDLMRRGRENNPDSWRIFFESGIISYLGYRDRLKSADYFLRAAEFPDAPEQTLRFAAFMTEERGDLQQALVMWRVVAETAKMDIIRERAQKKVEELEAALRAEREAAHDL